MRHNKADTDNFCDKKAIEKEVKEAEEQIQDLLTSTSESMLKFVIEKNQEYIDSLMNKIVFIPVKKCMESYQEIRSYGYKMDL